MSQLINRYSEDVFFMPSTPSTEKGELDSLSTGILRDFFLNIGVPGMTINRLFPGRVRNKRIGELDQTVAEKLGQTPESVRREGKATFPAGSYDKIKELVNTTSFNFSDLASYFTRSLIRCDSDLIKSVYRSQL